VRCPKCGFLSYPGLTHCKKCGYPFDQPIAHQPRAADSPPDSATGAPGAAGTASEPSSPIPLEETPLTPAAPPEPERPLREELAQRVEDHRQRRAQIRGEGEEATTLEFDFEGAGREPESPAVDSEIAELIKEDVELEISDEEAAISVPEASSLPETSPVDSLPLEKPEESAHILDSVAMEEPEPAPVEDTVPPEPVEIVLDTPLPAEEASGIEDGFAPLPLAPMGRRFLAGVLDAIVLLVSAGLFAFIFWRAGGHISMRGLNMAVLAFVPAFLIMAYFGLFTALTATTPGLLWMGLEIRGQDGGHPTPQDAFYRAFGCLVSTSALLLGFVWALVDSEGLTWHDRMSRTFLTTASPDDVP
jgi:uncharacterized RDD family membrane protein YckC